MQEIKAAGTTIVLVSHSMEQIERLCDRSIWINDGKIVMDGNPKDVDMAYLEFMNNERKARAENEDEKKKDPAERKRYGNQKAMFEKIRLLGKDGKEGKVFETGSPLTIRAQYKVSKKVEDAVFGIGIFRNDGLWVYGTNTRIAQKERFDLVKDGEFLFRIDSLDLIQGAYWLDVTIEWGNGNPVDYYKQAVKFEVVSKYKDVGVACFGHDWTYEV
jgi:ABC-2 type transport system ATP-binding protein